MYLRKHYVKVFFLRQVLKFAQMAKDAQLTFRITSELKTQIEAIAAKEIRSVAQVCEAFLKAGVEQYRRDGNRPLLKHLQRSAE